MREEEMTEEERVEWQTAASSFLQGKTPAEILEMFRTFKNVLEETGPSFDAFAEAVHEFAKEDENKSLEIGRLFMEDSDASIRTEAYWFFEPWLFTNPIAVLAVCETMLSDEDPSVVCETIVRLKDDLHDAGRQQPFAGLVHVAEQFQKAKQGLDAST